MMSERIGTAAGDIYHHLSSNGEATVAQLRKATGHPETLIHQALGWLAREDKLACDATARTQRWTLLRA